MKRRLIALSLLMTLAASTAVADSQHYATASTKKEAKRLATAEARATARVSALCFRPAYQVNECEKVEGGFRCRADSTDDSRTCRRGGWMRDLNPSIAWMDRIWVTDSWPSNPWSSAASSGYSGLYGRTVSNGAGPPQPPPFPSN